MSLPEAGAITILWSNVPPEHEEAIRKWHNLEHTTERLEGPGYIALHRYNREGGDGRHGRLNIFEGRDLATFDSPYYLESRNNPTPWTRKSMPLIQDGERSVCTLAASHGDRPRIEPPYLYTVRFGVAAGAEDDLLAWFREEHLPRLCALEGVMRGRVFKRDPALSGLETEETRIHEMKTIDWGFVALYELSTTAPLGTDAWKEAAAGTERSAEMIQKLLDPVREIWWWDFVKYAPGII